MDVDTLIKPEFVAARTEVDRDLVQEVHTILKDGGVAHAATWLDEHYVKEAQEKHPDLQRFLITRNLNAKLCGHTHYDTQAARFALHIRCDDAEYLHNLTKYVTPALATLYPVKAEPVTPPAAQ